MNASKQSKKRPRTKRSDGGGDIITVTEIGAGSVIAAGRSAKAQLMQSPIQEELERWRSSMETRIGRSPGLSKEEKGDAKEQLQKIVREASKGENADLNRLEKLINTLAVMSSDIFEVAIATLANPLLGVGLVLKKVGEKAKLEPKPNP